MRINGEALFDDSVDIVSELTRRLKRITTSFLIGRA